MTELGSTYERDDLGNGRFRLAKYLAPIAYRNGGGFARIVDDWVNGDANWPNVVTAAPMLVYCSADGNRRICPTRDPAKYFEVGAPYIKPANKWTQVALGNATRSGNKISWSTPQADVNVYMGGHYLKLEIPLRGGWQPPNGQFAFPVSLSGLTRQGLDFYDGTTKVASMRMPVVYDASNPDLPTRPIAATITQVSGQSYVLFTLPSLTGMTAPVIDPTLTLQPDETAGIDCNIADGTPDTNNPSGADVIRINYSSAARTGLIKFDLTSIPVGSTINSATLSLYVAATYSGGTVTHRVYRILAADSGWVEACTWNYANPTTIRWAGDAGSDGGVDAGCGALGVDYYSTYAGTWTVTTGTVGTEYAVTLNTADIASMRAANYGMVINAFTFASGVSYGSSGNATAGYRPKLVVDYTPPVTGIPRQAMYYARGRSV